MNKCSLTYNIVVFIPFGLILVRHASDQLTNPWRDLLNSLNNLNLGLIFQFENT